MEHTVQQRVFEQRNKKSYSPAGDYGGLEDDPAMACRVTVKKVKKEEWQILGNCSVWEAERYRIRGGRRYRWLF